MPEASTNKGSASVGQWQDQALEEGRRLLGQGQSALAAQSLDAAEEAAKAAERALARSPASGGPDETPAARRLLDRIKAARQAALQEAEARQRRQALVDAEELISRGYGALKNGHVEDAMSLCRQARGILKKGEVTPADDTSQLDALKRVDELERKARRVGELYTTGLEALGKAEREMSKSNLDAARKECTKSVDDFDLAIGEGGQDRGQAARNLLARIRQELDNRQQRAKSEAAEKRKAEAEVDELLRKGYFALRNGFPRF